MVSENKWSEVSSMAPHMLQTDTTTPPRCLRHSPVSTLWWINLQNMKDREGEMEPDQITLAQGSYCYKKKCYLLEKKMISVKLCFSFSI